MTIQLTTNTDGYGTEGIGSVAQWCLLLTCIAKDLGVTCGFEPFRNIAHYDYTSYQQDEWAQSFTSFFNLPDIGNSRRVAFNGSLSDLAGLLDQLKYTDTTVFVPKDLIVGVGQQNLNRYLELDYLSDIRRNLVLQRGIKYFDLTRTNICMHIRSLNPNDVDHLSGREYYSDSRRFLNLIDQLKTKHNTELITLHIHSQGNFEKFAMFTDQTTNSFQIKLHLNDHPTTDLYHMSHADYLVMANSSFSWMAHLLNSNPTYVRQNFWHATYPNKILLDADMNII